MAFKETAEQLQHFFAKLLQDLTKVQKGNKAAAQRVRVGTVSVAKLAKTFRKESIELEKDSHRTQTKWKRKKGDGVKR